jgi:hypothetical protein
MKEICDPKPRPNRKLYIESLKRMTPEQRLLKAIELSEMGKQMLSDNLRRQNPGLPEAELHRLFLARLARCHNRNY